MLFFDILESIVGVSQLCLHGKRLVRKRFFDKGIETFQDFCDGKGKARHFLIGCGLSPFEKKSFLAFAKDIEILFVGLARMTQRSIDLGLKDFEIEICIVLLCEKSAFAQFRFEIRQSQEKVLGRSGQCRKCILRKAFLSLGTLATRRLLDGRTRLHQITDKVVLQSWVAKGLPNVHGTFEVPSIPTHLSEWQTHTSRTLNSKAVSFRRELRLSSLPSRNGWAIPVSTGRFPF